MMIVLNAGKLLVEHADVVIVNQRDGADHVALGRLPRFFDELIADQVAEGFGAVGIAALADQLVELRKQIRIDGYANSAKAAHASHGSTAFVPWTPGPRFGSAAEPMRGEKV